MMSITRNAYYALLLALLLSASATAGAQEIVKMDVPRNICLGDSVLVTFGTRPTSNIMFQYPEVSRVVVDTVFLPDGIHCGDMGCAYTSTVNFTDFADGSTITTAEAIRYLRLNIEHSYIADIYIALTCPNGNYVDIMRFGGHPTAQCYFSIPSDSRQWLPGNNLLGNEHLGIANRHDNDGCDASENPIGTGWNYCWSNNTVSNYEYAGSGTYGIIYRHGHAHDGRVDSSNVAEHTNFYRPDDNFHSLIGCPLNGNWTIKVIDGYSGDNGYLYNWELALDGNLVEYIECPIDSFTVDGAGAVSIDDTSFLLTLPSGITHDTTINYTFTIYDHCGNVYDTTATVTYHAEKHIYFQRYIIENDLPYTFNGTLFDDSVTNYLFPGTDRYGCDSTIRFTLNVWRNTEAQLDTTVCSYNLPLIWLDSSISESCTLHYTLHTVNGADSSVTVTIRVLNVDTVEIFKQICNGISYTWIDGNTYDDLSQTPVYVLHRTPCDSIMRLHLVLSDDRYRAHIRANPNPVGNNNLNVTLTDITDSESRRWTIGDRNDTARVCTFIFPVSEDSVDVSLFARNRHGCTDSTSLTIRNNTHQLWAPNAFTPDESTNRTFAIATNQVNTGTVYIYSRTGNYITSFDLLTGLWDGTTNGRACPPGTYVWKADFTTKGSPRTVISRVGTVTIIR